MEVASINLCSQPWISGLSPQTVPSAIQNLSGDTIQFSYQLYHWNPNIQSIP